MNSIINQISLKKLTHNQQNELFQIYSNIEVLKFTDNNIHSNINNSHDLISWYLAGDKNNTHYFFGIFYTDKLIGTIGLYHIDWKHKFASLSCILYKDFWRKGIMTHSLKKLINIAFLKYNLNRLEAQIYENHEASINLFKKLGFKKEALLRRNFLINNKFENSYLFTLLNEEFENNTNFNSNE